MTTIETAPIVFFGHLLQQTGKAVKLSDFNDNSLGEIVPIVAASPLVTHAFVPRPLPPDFSWPLDLWPLLSDAENELARLDGTGKALTDPELLLTPLQEREALKSSSLEGTYTDPQGQMLFKLSPEEPTSESDPKNAYREVFNYARALRQGESLLDELPLSEKLIRRLHFTLMDGVRGQNKRPGEIRNRQVHIGNPPRFVPPPADQIPGLLHNLGHYLNLEEPAGLRPLARAFIAHYQFETIHPFLDGNGRVGRLLLALSIKEWEGLAKQWLYMSAFFDANKDDYISHLYRVSTHGDWRGWLEFCLRGVIEQAKDAIRRCEALLELQVNFRQRIQSIKGSNRLGAIVDQLFSNSVLQIPRVAEAFDVTYHTARRDVEKLVKLEILSETELGGVRTFLAPEILGITYD